MKGFVTLSAGVEEAAVSELRSFNAADVEAQGTAVTFSFPKVMDFAAFAYRSQSVSRLCILLAEFKVEKSLDAAIASLKSHLNDFKITGWVSTWDSFMVDVSR